VQEGNESEAIEDFQKAVALDPTNPDIYHHRAQVTLDVTVAVALKS
jgi:Flp pilus assembly protein TadD